MPVFSLPVFQSLPGRPQLLENLPLAGTPRLVDDASFSGDCHGRIAARSAASHAVGTRDTCAARRWLPSARAACALVALVVDTLPIARGSARPHSAARDVLRDRAALRFQAELSRSGAWSLEQWPGPSSGQCRLLLVLEIRFGTLTPSRLPVSPSARSRTRAIWLDCLSSPCPSLSPLAWRKRGGPPPSFGADPASRRDWPAIGRRDRSSWVHRHDHGCSPGACGKRHDHRLKKELHSAGRGGAGSAFAVRSNPHARGRQPWNDQK